MRCTLGCWQIKKLLLILRVAYVSQNFALLGIILLIRTRKFRNQSHSGVRWKVLRFFEEWFINVFDIRLIHLGFYAHLMALFKLLIYLLFELTSLCRVEADLRLAFIAAEGSTIEVLLSLTAFHFLFLQIFPHRLQSLYENWIEPLNM